LEKKKTKEKEGGTSFPSIGRGGEKEGGGPSPLISLIDRDPLRKRVLLLMGRGRGISQVERVLLSVSKKRKSLREEKTEKPLFRLLTLSRKRKKRKEEGDPSLLVEREKEEKRKHVLP